MGLLYSRGVPVTESTIVRESKLQCATHQKEAIGLCIQKNCSKPVVICSQCMSDTDGHRCSMLSMEEARQTIKAYVDNSDPRIKELEAAVKKYFEVLRELALQMIKSKEQEYLWLLEQYFVAGGLEDCRDIYRSIKSMDIEGICKAGRSKLPAVMKVLNTKQVEIPSEQWEILLKEVALPNQQTIDDALTIPSISKELDRLLGMAPPVVQPVISYTPAELPTQVLLHQEQKDSFLTIFNSNLGRFKRLNLLFRASQHSYSSAKFHALCQDVPNTLVLARAANDEVFGGYTPCKWTNDGSGYASDAKGQSFLFSVSKLKVYGLRKGMLETAIHNSEDLGPAFGRGHDLLLSDRCNEMLFSHANLGKSYDCPEAYGSTSASTALAGANNFLVREYEVWQLS